MIFRLMAHVWVMLLGASAHRRLRVSHTLFVLCTYLLFSAVQHAEVLLGLVDARESAALMTFFLTGSACFYIAIRSGWSERFKDPSLTLPQMVLGVVASVGSYAITGQARAAVMTLLVLILVYGMFALQRSQARSLAWLTAALLGAAMLFKALTDPTRYPPMVEAIHFIFALIVLGCVATLADRMAVMRSRLREQKASLGTALAQIRQLAIQDDLTGLANRRHMGELMALESARQQRAGQPISLALLDLDLFKRINDTYGHHGGDLVLKAFSQVAGRDLRAADVLARWGGEEFLLMLPGTPPEEALLCIERMRTSLARISDDAIAPGLRVTFSAGISVCEPGGNMAAAIDQADQAMYRAKAQGRNCTVMAEGISTRRVPLSVAA